MVEFNIQSGAGEYIIHLAGDNSRYEVIYDHGQIIFQNAGLRYIIPENVGHKFTFLQPDPNTGKRTYITDNVRSLYRDTTPTDFGLGSNLTDVEPGSSHFTEEVLVGGVNEYISVVAPAGVNIWINGVIQSSGTHVNNGDVVQFEFVASSEHSTVSNYIMSIGDITKSFSIMTKINQMNEIDGGNWTVFASNSSTLTGNYASAGAITYGTVGFDTTSIGTIDITGLNWTDLAAVGLNADGTIKFWIAYTNISNVDSIKAEMLDFVGETSGNTNCQTTFGHAEIKTWNGSQLQNFTTENAVFEIHHGNWNANNNTNWILSEKARNPGNGRVNNWAITSHGRNCSINGVGYYIDPSIGESTVLLYR